MNSLMIHQIETIKIKEIHQLNSGIYCRNIIITKKHNLNGFEISLFSDKKEVLENIKF